MPYLFINGSLKLSGTADSYNLVPVDPHVNAQRKHRRPKNSGRKQRRRKKAVAPTVLPKSPSPQIWIFETSKAIKNLILNLAAAPREDGGEKKVGGRQKRGREGNIGF